jgi:hypothetical protein
MKKPLKNTGIALTLLLGAGLTLGCSQDEPSTPEDDAPISTYVPDTQLDFYGMVRRVHFNYSAYGSVDQLRNASDVVVKGRLVDLQDGKKLGETGPRGRHFFVMKFEVDEALRGTVGQYVYVEHARTGWTSIESLKKALPDHEMTLYLTDVTNYADSFPASRVFGKNNGYPTGERLFMIKNPQAMVVHFKGQNIQPLADRAESLFASGKAAADQHGH